VNCPGTNAALTECLVPIAVLTASPFNLPFDELIVAQVSAYNSYGWGATSAINTAGAKIRRVPDTMGVPLEVSRTDSTISIRWTALTGVKTGNSPITAYNLYWDTVPSTGME
jgi:hypothetical protein